MMFFIVFVALIGLLFLIASIIAGINFPLLAAALFFFTGSGVLYAARRSRSSPAEQGTTISKGRLRNAADDWLPDPKRFLLAMAFITYGLAVLSLFGQFVPDPTWRRSQLLGYVFYKFGPLGLVVLFASIGTGLLIAAIHKTDK